MPVKSSEMAPLIAIIGCDGSGKSTVSEQILMWANGYAPAASAHLGKQQGNIARSLAKLPLLGKWIEALISRKVAKVNKSQDKNTTPGVIPAIVMYAFTLRRVRRFRRMLALRRQGLIVITDRFPQLEFPAAYDGPALSVAAEGSAFVRWLATREQKAFEKMTQNKPDLVIRLNVDLDTACARKPDHLRELLQRKIEVTPLLTFNGASIAEIDSAQALDEVLADAKEAVSALLTARGYSRKEN